MQLAFGRATAYDTAMVDEDSDSDNPNIGNPMDRVSIGPESAHVTFQRQIDKLLSDANVSDEDRQRILTNTVCPCCGSAASQTVKLED